MPSLLKDHATGRLGRLISVLRPARAGPLPVQTGFPTSLADLFVKNHGRLRKPSSCASGSSRRKKRGGPPSPSPPPSPAPSPPASSPPSPPPHPVAVSPLPPPAAVSPPTQPRPDLPEAEPVCDAAGGSAFGLGLGFLALLGVVMSLAILVIWSRRVVAAVTVAALSLFLLEPIRSFSLRREPRPPATREALDLGVRGYVSPIREAEVEPEPPTLSCSDSDRWTDVSYVLVTEDTVEERSEAGDDSGSSRGKAKRRSWRKLIPRKLQKGRVRKGDADSSLSSSFRSDADIATVGGSATRATDRPDSRRGSGRHQADGTVSGNATRAMDHPDSRRGSGRHQAGSVADAAGKSSDPSGPRRGTGTGMDAEVRSDGGVPIGIDASSADRPVPVADGVGGNRLPFVAAVIVAGKLPAVAFTVLFVSSLQRLSCRREGR